MSSVSGKTVRRMSWSGVGVGALALIACELPLILAVIGMGGLSGFAAAVKPPPFVEMIAIFALVAGAVSLAVILVLRVRRARRREL
jgi:hypothetical protein